MENAANRKEIVTKLREKCSDLGFKRSKASDVGGKWARISAIEIICEWGEDDDIDSEAIRASLIPSWRNWR